MPDDVTIKSPVEGTCLPASFLAFGTVQRTIGGDPITSMDGKLARTFPTQGIAVTVSGRQVFFKDPGAGTVSYWAIKFSVPLHLHGECKLIVTPESQNAPVGNPAEVAGITPVHQLAGCVRNVSVKKNIAGGFISTLGVMGSDNPIAGSDGKYKLTKDDKDYFPTSGYTDARLDKSKTKFGNNPVCIATQDDSDPDDLWWVIFTGLGTVPGNGEYDFVVEDTAGGKVTVTCVIAPEDP